MEKRLEKNLYTQISADAALKIMETLRKEGYEDLPRKYQDLKGSTLVLTYQAPDPVKVRPKVGEAIDWDKHELRVGDRVEHPILTDRNGNHQGTVVVKEVLSHSFTYERPDIGVWSGCDNKTWIFKGGAKVRPTIGTKLDFEKHTLEIGDYISKDEGSVYRVTSKERFDCPSYGAKPGSPAYNIEYVSGADRYETWAWLADFWTLTSAPKTHPKIGELVYFDKHELKIGDFIKGRYSDLVYEVMSRSGDSYTVKNVDNGNTTSAWASDYWIRVEKPAPKVVYPVVGQKVRWANDRGDSCTGRVYKIEHDQFWFIVDEYTGCGGPKGCQGYITKLHIENGSCKVIAD